MQNSKTLRNIAALTAVLVVAIVVVALAILRPWSQVAIAMPDEGMSVVAAEEVVAEEPQSAPVAPEPKEPLVFTITAGGDMLIHNSVARDARTETGWDFAAQMAPISPYLQSADLALCNMEIPLVPRDQEPSGYPIFGAPQDLAPSMVAAGWNGCSTSTNHALDQGFSGIQHTLNSFDEVGLGHVGTARTEAEANTPQLYRIEGEDQEVTIAHISAAHDTNGLPLPEGAPWAVQLIDVDQLIGQARAAREAGADMVIASIHCCSVEYTTDPEQMQIDIAEALAASGEVDLYLSHHAHVPKTIEFLEGGPNGNGMWTAYGLGNFISNQDTACCRQETSTGLLGFFTAVKNPGEAPKFIEATWQPVTVDIPGGHMVYPLGANGAEGSILPPEVLAQRHALMAAIMEGSPAAERTGPPEDQGNTTTVIPRS